MYFQQKLTIKPIIFSQVNLIFPLVFYKFRLINFIMIFNAKVTYNIKYAKHQQKNKMSFSRVKYCLDKCVFQRMNVKMIILALDLNFY